MLTALIVSQIVSWLVILMMAVALVALARQVGVLHVRVAPAGALSVTRGPATGEKSPHLHVTTLSGAPLAIGAHLAAGKRQLLMFVSAQCHVCKGLIPVAKSFARDERVELVFVGDDEASVQRGLIAGMDIASYPFVNGPEVGMAYQVDKLPYAVLLDEHGTILAKGLVNSREHLESLVVSQELGVKSVQDYITGLNKSENA